MARRAGFAEPGIQARERLNADPTLTFHPISDGVLAAALDLGTRHLLRGADSIYAATATFFHAQLISWDNTLTSRAGALSPSEWLSARC